MRKCEVIQTANKVRREYKNAMVDIEPKKFDQNYSIKIIKNVTKEQKTVADLPNMKNIVHRYNYNYVPNIANTSSHSIDMSTKSPKSGFVPNKRKLETIKNETYPRKEYKVSAVEVDEYGRTIAYAEMEVPDGDYKVEVVTDQIHPIQFLLTNQN